MRESSAIHFFVLMMEIFLFLLLIHLGLSLHRFSAEANPYRGSLPIPPVLVDKNPDPGVADFELTVQKSKSAFYEDKYSETYGYNGNYLGPVIRVKRGDKVTITVKNHLDEDTTVHWHGLLVPGEMDGGPHYSFGSGKERNGKSILPSISLLQRFGIILIRMGKSESRYIRDLQVFLLLMIKNPRASTCQKNMV